MFSPAALVRSPTENYAAHIKEMAVGILACMMPKRDVTVGF